jgi:hypothetical protein
MFTEVHGSDTVYVFGPEVRPRHFVWMPNTQYVLGSDVNNVIDEPQNWVARAALPVTSPAILFGSSPFKEEAIV